MKQKLIVLTVCVLTVLSCSKPDKSAVPTPAPEAAAVPVAAETPPQVNQPPKEGPPIDIGDVDSGIFIRGILAPESQSPAVTAEYIESMRGKVSLATITVREPFPEKLLVRFELTSKRNFEERPVVVRARALRGEEEVIGEEYACIMGSDAMMVRTDDAGVPQLRGFSVDVLQGLAAIPDTMLVHGRADAWLMPEGTAENLLDAKAADSTDHVPLVGNPVRINFIKAEPAP